MIRPSVAIVMLAVVSLVATPARAAAPDSLFFSPQDGAFDVSGFLESRYGFLPLPFPITEPAVGYGGGGALLFIDKPLAGARSGYGRPNISMVGGLGTQNGTWAAMAGDIRQWFDDRLQSRVALISAAVNLDFYGLGDHRRADPLRYELDPKGGLLELRSRISGTRTWAGLRYGYASTRVHFEEPPGTSGLPDYREHSKVGSVTPSLSFDSRDNILTPLRGTYVEATVGFYAQAFGGDDDFQTVNAVAMQFVPLSRRLFLGLRTDGKTCSSNAPFYVLPFIQMRGAPVMRYQGEAVLQGEAELRWQRWNRWSVVGFAGGGAAANDYEGFAGTKSIVTGGVGFRYELARAFGVHAGMDVAWGPDNTAIYFQTGSAWARP